jgi:hypothetical protein
MEYRKVPQACEVVLSVEQMVQNRKRQSSRVEKAIKGSNTIINRVIWLDDEGVRHLHRGFSQSQCVKINLSLCNVVMLLNINLSLSYV